ncbi:BREX protein BrxB domain-containing protein [Sorangium sp. So ce1335]|uniref:BREX protein BrxB domain-containing protein n=1 Tax=Sorangium sp. So ce1335 TaxID=3133335 RepID=UPI003F5E0A43
MSSYRPRPELVQALEALRKDLLSEDGPQISTVRNYNFAILPYDPEDEFKLRQAIRELSDILRDAGWNAGTIPLNALLLARLRAQGSEFLEAMIQREKRLAVGSDPWRGLRTLKERVATLLEGPEGLAQDVLREVDGILERSDNPERTVIFLGRAGALYPFFRTSALLKHVAGRTRNVPVVLLYPGKVIGETGLSFMGVLPADRDYRPRIYR